MPPAHHLTPWAEHCREGSAWIERKPSNFDWARPPVLNLHGAKLAHCSKPLSHFAAQQHGAALGLPGPRAKKSCCAPSTGSPRAEGVLGTASQQVTSAWGEARASWVRQCSGESSLQAPVGLA